MNQVEKGIASQFPAEHVVLNCNCLSFFMTYQGIDNCGLRLYEDIIEYVKHFADGSNGRDRISTISFIGYSMGGLICRYCIGLLEKNSFFNTVSPMHLITIATPHIGTRLKYRTFTGRAFNYIGSWLVNLYAGRSGKQIALLDGTISTEPLLLEMTQPGSFYMKGLKKFPHLYVYANASNDSTVPYCTSSLSYRNKWRNSGVTVQSSRDAPPKNSEYAFILETEKIRDDPDAALFAEKHTVKNYDWDILNLLLLIAVVLFGFPFLCVHIALLAIPMRLISLCYSVPEESKLCPRLHCDMSSPIDPDLCPWIILKNMRDELDIHRVTVKLPGVHTHGKIVCRFQPNEGGLSVIRHIAEQVLSLQILNNEKINASVLGEYITDINLNLSDQPE